MPSSPDREIRLDEEQEAAVAGVITAAQQENVDHLAAQVAEREKKRGRLGGLMQRLRSTKKGQEYLEEGKK